jgi:class 3 adenylate cyclase/tetratricopeptide (TPR) repeat protein
MPRCPNCSAEIEPTDRFCWSCGREVTPDCASCGSNLRPGSTFCAECGTPVHTPLETVEHRLVTALYVDLVGSTALAEQLDPENLAAIVGGLHENVRIEVGERQGSVGAFVGDGVLGVFGLPAAHDDDPSRAIHAARAILDRTEELSETAQRRWGVRIEARVGINTGDLLAPATDEPDLGTLAGDVLNVAARLHEIAEPGQIVVSERTARPARGFRFDDLGVIDVRGRARPIHAYRVAGETEIRPVVMSGPFLGRTEALAAMRNAFKQVSASGKPHHVAVIGDAGVGKSRLVRETIDWAAGVDATLTVLSGRCLPYGEDITYRSLTEILTDLTGVGSGEDLEKARTRIAALLAESAGDQLEAMTDTLLRMIGFDLEGDIPPRRFREELRAAWRTVLTAVATDGPVIVLIEDVHWASDAVLDVVDHAVRRGEGPFLMVTPARPEVFQRRPEWRTGGDRPQIVQVSPLEQDEARRLAGRLLAHTGLPAREAVRIAERAAGNPFFMEELVRQMAHHKGESGRTDDAELPATIQGVVSARIDLLGPPDRRVLQAASVMGRIFWPSAVGALVELSEADVRSALDSLEAMQLVRPHLKSSLEGEREYLFQHSLIGETAYGRLSRPDLARLHGRMAEWLQSRQTEERTDIAERLAYHTAKAYASARDTPEFAEPEVERLRILAIERLLAGSRSARERGVFSRAIDLARSALEHTGGADDAWRAHEELGLTHLAEYDGDAAWRELTRAVDLHLQLDTIDAAEVARLTAAAVESPLRWTGTMQDITDLEATMRYVQLGLEHAGTADSEALALLLIAIGFVIDAAARREVDPGISPDEAQRSAIRGLEMARRLDLPDVQSAALDALMSQALVTGRIQQAAEIADRRLELVDQVRDPWEIGDTYAMAAWLSYDLGDYERARDRADRGFEATVDDAPSVAVHTLTWGGLARVQTGDWDQVLGHLKRARDLLDDSRRDRPPRYAAPLFAAAAMVYEYRGRAGDADRMLRILSRVGTTTDGHPLAPWARHIAPILIRRDEFERAGAVLAPERTTERIGIVGDRLASLCDLVAARGSWEEADSVVEETRATGAAYGLGALAAHAERLEGRASLAARDRVGGRNLLASARDRFEALGDRWEAARTTLELAEAGGNGDVAGAAGRLEQMGAVDELERARRLLDGA